MKKIILLFILFVYNINFSQGSDIIMLIDNSGSITTTEYNQMAASIREINERVLACNPNNRVAVLHYGTLNGSANTNTRVYIESNFTNNLTVANNFQRRLGSGDYLHTSMSIIGNALDNIPNPNIVSPQTSLTRNFSNNLVIFIFTDGIRSTASSYLVNFNNSATNNINAFTNFVNFKNNRNTSFVVVHVSTNALSQNAGAVIASRGGSYNGGLETFVGEPDNNQLPRLYLLKNNFILTETEIDTVSEDICEISINASISLNPVNENCPLFPLQVCGNFTIPVGATVSNLNLQVLNSANQVVSTVTNPTVNSNQFCFSVNEANFGTAPVAGNFELRVTATVTLNGQNLVVTFTSANTGPDVSFNDCSICCPDCCDDNLSLSFPVVSGQLDTRQANLRIQAVNTIQNGAFASYHAGSFVLLKDGFHAQSGSRMRAYIEGCSGTYFLREGEQVNFEYRHSDGNGDNENLLNANQLKFYPNPTSDVLYLDSGENSILSYAIYDQSGNLLDQNAFDYKKQSIDFKNFAIGHYIVELKFNNNESQTIKIIKY